MSDNFNKEYALYRRGKSKYLYLGEVEDTDKYKNPKSFYKTVEEEHQKTFELYHNCSNINIVLSLSQFLGSM